MSVKKILCITNDFGPRAGGIETFVIGLIERLPKNSVIVYTSSQAKSEPFDQAWLQNYGVEVIRDPSRTLLPSLRVGRAVRALARERAITRVFFGAAAPLALLSQGLRRAGVERIVALTHGHEVWWAKLWPFSALIHRIGTGVDHLTYLGEFTGRNIAKPLSQRAQSAMVKIAPGIDTNHFAPHSGAIKLRNDLALSDKKVIVSVGRLVHRKGQDTLVEALPMILREVPDAHLLFVGEGPRRDFMQKRAEKLGVAAHITFIGRIQYLDLPQYICVGDIFAMPSRSRLAGLEVEGLGIVYLEASACGIAVIGGTSGGAPDAVIDGQTGIVVDGKSESDVARAAIKLLKNPELAKQMGARGRQWIIDEWQWDRWATEFNSLLIEDQPFAQR
jgi:phosphatidylinositol alpha-1,6-mannosyltransferase